MNSTILEASDISFAYRNDPVLNDVSFKINKGDFVALIGANGSGKSTLIRIVLGLLKSDSGSLTIDRKAHNIAYIPQGGIESIDFLVSVEELLMFRNKKSSKKDVKKALEAVGMQDSSHKLVKNLSGGQRQRVLIARELMAGPCIMFLDEPTNGLDTESIHQLHELLIELNQKQNITLVMVTHHIDDVFTKVNRVFEMKDHTLKEQSHV